MSDDWITTHEASVTLERTSKTLERWRKDRYGPQPVKRVGRAWLYSRRQVDEFAQMTKRGGGGA